MRTRPAIGAVWCALVLAAGCGGGGGGGGGDDDPTPTSAAWTVLVYGHGDHNLTPALEQDMAEMASAQIGDDINVLVFADWDASQQGYPTGAHWYAVRGGRVDEIDSIAEEVDFDAPETLAYAVAEGFAAAPADRYALVLWNHGGAWRGGFGGDTQNGTAQPSAMPIPLVAAAVESGATEAGLRAPIDIVAFDTCLLGSAEAAAEFAGLAQLFVGNGEIDYGPGWDYEKVLTYLSDHPTASLREIAVAETEAYDAHHRGTVVDSLLRAHVTLDMAELPAFATAAAGLVDAVTAAPHALAVGRAMFGASPGYFNDAFSPEGARMPGLHDIAQVADLLAGSPEAAVATAAGQVQGALDDLVIARSLGGLRSSQGGMHVELTPAIEVTTEHLQAYQRLAPAWNQATDWSSLIATVAQFADGNAPVVTGTGVSGPTPGVSFRIADPDVADARVELAIAGQGGHFGLGLIGAGAVASATDLSFGWNGRAFAMTTSSGLESLCAMPWNVAYAADGSAEIPVLFTPGLVAAGETEALVMLVFDPTSGAAPLLLVPQTESNTWASFAVSEVAGATFQPLVPWYADGGGIDVARLGTVAIQGDRLTVTTATMAPATYQLLLSVRDVWGNESITPFDVALTAGARRARTAAPLRPALLGTGLGPRADAIVRRIFETGRPPALIDPKRVLSPQAEVALPTSPGWSGLGAFTRR